MGAGAKQTGSPVFRNPWPGTIVPRQLCGQCPCFWTTADASWFGGSRSQRRSDPSRQPHGAAGWHASLRWFQRRSQATSTVCDASTVQWGVDGRLHHGPQLLREAGKASEAFCAVDLAGWCWDAVRGGLWKLHDEGTASSWSPSTSLGWLCWPTQHTGGWRSKGSAVFNPGRPRGLCWFGEQYLHPDF